MAKLRILLRAPENTIFLGKELIHLDRVDSTNTYLKNLLSGEKAPKEGAMVFAEDQFAGKGQLGAFWTSEPGKNILASFLFVPTFLDPKHIFYFNKAVAIAVRDSVEHLLRKFSPERHNTYIKWPNDIMVEGKKIAGILIENTFRANSIENCITGIGINVNQKFGSEKHIRAVSLSELTADEVDVSDALAVLCAMLEKYYFMLRGLKFKEIDKLYHNNLFGIGEDRIFITDGNRISGKIIGVGEDGLLNLESDCIIRKFEVKQIDFLFA